MDNPFWEPIKRSLATAAIIRTITLISTSVVFPVAEGLLLARGSHQNDFWTAFKVVAGLHILFFTILVLADRSYPPSVLAKAFEQFEDLQRANRNLQSQTCCYQFVEAAFASLSGMPCLQLTYSAPGEAMALAYEVYRLQLSKMVAKLTDKADAILGVEGHRFTLQVIFLNGFMHTNDQSAASPSDRLVCELLHDPTNLRPPETMAAQDNKQLAAYCFNIPKRIQQHILGLPHLLENGRPPSSAYFRRFAFSEILTPCTEHRCGIVLLTSMQDGEFSPNVLDTLQLLGAAVATFTASFYECVENSIWENTPTSVVLTVAGAPPGIATGAFVMGRSGRCYADEASGWFITFPHGRWLATNPMQPWSASFGRDDLIGQYSPLDENSAGTSVTVS